MFILLIIIFDVDYRLVIICSNEDEEKSHFISKLHLFKRTHIPPSDIQLYRKYLITHFTNQTLNEEASATQYDASLSASIVDNDKYVHITKIFILFTLFYHSSCVRIILSNRSGMGKSLYVQRLAENLKSHGSGQFGAHVTIPLHGPVVTPDTVLDLFKDQMKNPTCCIYHIDIAPNVSLQSKYYTLNNARHIMQLYADIIIINTDLMGSGHYFV